MYRIALFLVLLSMPSCKPLLLGEAQPEPIPAPHVEAPAPPVVMPLPVVPAPEPEITRVAFAPGCSTLNPCTPPPAPVEPSKMRGKGGSKSAPEPSPQQVIIEAQKEARVAPTKRGYFGAKGVHRFLWSPGKIYDVYLTPGNATKLELPPGEVLAHAVMLNPKSFDVATATVGDELKASTVILIRPCAHGDGDCLQSKDVDVALTSLSGRSYDLHLIIGTVGMIGATWELVPVSLIEKEEPGMLPRRQP